MASYPIVLTSDDTQLDRSIDRASEKLDGLAAKASDITIGSRGGGGGGSGKGGSNFVGLSNPMDMGYGLAPTPRDVSLMEAREARRVENEGRLLAAQYSGTSPRGTGAKVADALMTSRIGPGGMYPLVNRIAGAFGVEALGAAGVGFAVKQAIDAGMESNRALQQAQYISGGNTREAGQLASLGGFLGRSPQESAMASEGFGNALHGGTFGAGYFLSRGIRDFGGLTPDKVPNYIAASRALAEEPSGDVAQRVAQDTGMQSELRLRDLTSTTREQVLNNALAGSSPGERRAQAEYDAASSMAASGLGKVWRGISYPFVKIAADILNPVGTYDANRKEGLHRVVDMSNLPPEEKARQHAAIDGKKYEPAHSEHTASNGAISPSQSVRTQVGRSGGGPRVDAAYPASARAQQFSENAQAYGQYVAGYPSG